MITDVADGTVVVTGDAHRVLGASGVRVQVAVRGTGMRLELSVTDALAETPWWLSAAKAVVIFGFLVVSTLVMIWAERRVVAGCSSGSVRTGWARSACSRDWPTASSWR